MSLFKLLGVVLVAVGIGLGVVAYRAARVPPTSEASPAADSATELVVVAIEDLPAGKPVRARSVSLKGVTLVPEGAFRDPADVLDRAPSVPLSRGEPLLPKHFGEEGTIARMLYPGERAVAVKIDKVIGLGGFVQAGDHVDVLSFLRRDGREVQATQARILLSGVRVLAFGKDIEAREDGRPALDARTAVLAVPEKDAALLMLGDTAGKLRLALRHGAQEPTPARSRPATLADLLPEAGPARDASSPVTVIRGGRRSGGRVRR